MENREAYLASAPEHGEKVEQERAHEVETEELWEFVREEARELGLPEEEYVAQSRRAVAHLLEMHPNLKGEMKRHEEALLAELRHAAEPSSGE